MKTAGWIAVSAASIVGGAIAFWFIKSSRVFGETARYQRLLKDGAFEVREYENLALAGTEAFDDDESFMRLFGYISGQNHAEEEISMTTPVLIAEEGGRRTMNFVLPEKVAGRGAPPPTAANVKPGELSAGRFAVYRYAGFNNLLAESGNAAVLRSWMREQGLTPGGEPLVALYDPPWIPAPIRRNEILLRIADRR